jgi:hypothetical protein
MSNEEDECSCSTSTSAPAATLDRRAWLMLLATAAALPAGRAFADAEQDALLDAELPSAAPPTDAAELPRGACCVNCCARVP